jgi:hypothetical protein
MNLYDRICNHLWRNGSVSNSHLQAAIALYGLENFEYFVIEFVTEKGLLIKEEQKYLDIVPSNLRYNFCPTAGSSLGAVHSAETKAAMSEAHKGKVLSAETKAAISNAQKGNTYRALCVYVYDSNNVLVDTFPSQSAAIKEYNISKGTIYRLLDSKKLWNNLYYFTTTPLAP